VQDERDVIHGGRFDRALRGRARHIHAACRIHLDGQDRHAAGGAPSLFRAGRRKQEHAGVGIFQVKTKLVFLVSRIQRRRRAGHRCGEEAHDGGESVRQCHADAVAAADTGSRQRLGDGLYLMPQRAIRDANVLFRKNNGGSFCWAGGEQTKQRGRCAVCGDHIR
jgi:hypothetical protein